MSGPPCFPLAYPSRPDRDRGSYTAPRLMEVAPVQYNVPQSSVTTEFKAEDATHPAPLTPLQTEPLAAPTSSPMQDVYRRHDSYHLPQGNNLSSPRPYDSNDWYSSQTSFGSKVSPSPRMDPPRRSTIPTSSPHVPFRPSFSRRASETTTYSYPYPECSQEKHHVYNDNAQSSSYANQPASSPAFLPYPPPPSRTPQHHHQQYAISPSLSSSTGNLSSQSPCPSESSIDHERPCQRRRTTPSSSSSYERGISFEPEDNHDTNRPTSSRSRQSKGSPIQRSTPIRGRPKSSSINENAQGSFATFMVKPSPASYEPVGATYMSTVDFQSDSDVQTFEHGPTDLPPRQYLGGVDAHSPWKPRKNLGTIPGSALDYLPSLEDRISRLEPAVQGYLKYRGKLAVHNATLPASEDEPDVEVSPAED